MGIFPADMTHEEKEDNVIQNCSPSKWQAHKKSKSKPFCIELVDGINAVFEFDLVRAKKHIEQMLLTLRFHTFLRDHPDVMQLKDEIRIWVLDIYAKSIMASQKA
ncbi:hypothetical protein PFISCL1PPCAC_2377 [Pristionchus fissidentatus]|uniref:Uncharacterized protein n=1 Tax=Pristionchus fissidentatus TaxID=1538716 RepID=A0AAV5UXZ6_9BILA|nr:hypothetical protein PFISCL1PPCAC_2377 [Pristionchus fissidentatus]